MIALRRSDERGTANFGWLNSRHSFSFGHYHDPRHMGFGPLRVINEDQVAPGGGFDTHGHSDMEIISYVLSGALEHKDSMGNGSIIRPGDVQVMSAGTGVLHSEFNASDSEPVHFLQIWVIPQQKGLHPGYAQQQFSDDDKRNRLRLVGSGDAREGSVLINQDVDLFASVLEAGHSVYHTLAQGRRAWLQVIRGTIAVNGQQLETGDGLGLQDVAGVEISASEDAELLLFDMP